MNEHIRNLLQKTWALPAATGVAGLGVGAFVGYLFTKSQYDKIERELESVRDDQNRIDRVINERERQYNVQISRVAAVAKELREAGEQMLRDAHATWETGIMRANPQIPTAGSGSEYYDYATIAGEKIPIESEEQQPELTVVRNVFDTAGDEWDYKTELENRNEDAPYIIHVDEYMSDEMGWDSQSTLTWYEKDQILTDERDTPIYDVQAVVGELRFGHGSNDPNVVFVRNHQLHAEYEVLRDPGSYQEIVLNEKFEAEAEQRELKHSHNLRFRSD